MKTPLRRAPPARKTDEGAANSYYFRKKTFLPGNDAVQQDGHDGADDGADQGNDGVAPVGGTLALDGQEGVGDTGADVTGGVQGVAGQAAQGHTDGDDDAEDQQVADAGGSSGGNALDGEDRTKVATASQKMLRGRLGMEGPVEKTPSLVAGSSVASN